MNGLKVQSSREDIYPHFIQSYKTKGGKELALHRTAEKAVVLGESQVFVGVRT